MSAPPLAHPQSISSRSTTVPTSSTVACIARAIASADPGPLARSTADGGPLGSPTHHPPLRPDAPKPAVSRSSTTTRSDGSARRR